MPCRALFEGLPTSRDQVGLRAGLIEQSCPEGFCETQSVSSHSAGMVSDEEFLHRLVFSPLHMNGDKVLPTLFSDCKDKGLSCDRSERDEVDPDLHAKGAEMVLAWNVENPDAIQPRAYVGVVTALSGKIRAMRADGKRLMAVYDTGLPEQKTHADVFQITSRSNSEMKQARRDLALVFSALRAPD